MTRTLKCGLERANGQIESQVYAHPPRPGPVVPPPLNQ